ncbi:hypothetical protein AAF712_006470 [Marasmius tenuissimus]|uniref:Uncharacterized protein n=1 Tax=Marasmius tenuissimus TaxID=585030 RepID=A0ABR2ZYI1_9AGAR
MDPIGILSAVISTASFLIDWMEARRGQERTLNDIHTTVRNIHQSILLSLIEKSKAKTLDSRLAGPLEALHDVLRRTQDHLVGWEQSRSKRRARIWATVNPWAIQDKLKDDERKLMVSMQILATSMMAVSITLPECRNEGRVSPLDISTNPGVRRFWALEIGEQVSYCTPEALISALCHYFEIELKNWAKDIIALRLDEYGSGKITLANLDSFVGSLSLFEAIKNIDIIQDQPQAKGLNPTRNLEPTPSSKPILILVDDCLENHTETLDHAESLGINSYAFTSTAAAKTWIEYNEDMLHHADEAAQLRVVSDNARWEKDVDADPSQTSVQFSMNLRAGEAIIRFLRGRQFTAPILISAGYSMPVTDYVLQYTNTGSTCFQEVVNDFLDPLSGRPDDGWWCDFDVQGKSFISPTVMWVNEDITGDRRYIENGVSLGLKINTFTSTEAAQEEMTSNERVLKRLDSAHLLLFVSYHGQAGEHSQVGSHLHQLAPGEQLLKTVRSNGYRSPFMVFCLDTATTTYTCEYENAKPTAAPDVLMGHLRRLAERRSDDGAWERRGAR